MKIKLFVRFSALFLILAFFFLPLVRCNLDGYAGVAKNAVDFSLEGETAFNVSTTSHMIGEHWNRSYVFVLLLVPVLLPVLTFVKSSPKLWRNVSFAGLLILLAVPMIELFRTFVDGKDGVSWALTSYYYIKAAVYAALVYVTHRCLKQAPVLEDTSSSAAL
jgi:hypothetical protein